MRYVNSSDFGFFDELLTSVTDYVTSPDFIEQAFETGSKAIVASQAGRPSATASPAPSSYSYQPRQSQAVSPYNYQPRVIGPQNAGAQNGINPYLIAGIGMGLLALVVILK